MKRFSHRKRRWAPRGVSLVEAVLASVVLSIAVAAVATALVAGTQQSYLAVDYRRATELADAMMEEILALPYDDPNGASTPGPEAGESTRADFDNIDDYHNYGESAGAIVDKTGNSYPTEYDSFARSVTVALGTQQPTGFTQAVSGVTIAITISLNGETATNLSRFAPAPPS